MSYKIMQLISTSNSVDYWAFVKVDETSTTDYSTTDLAVLETKMLELMQTTPKNKLQIVSVIPFIDDLTIG